MGHAGALGGDYSSLLATRMCHLLSMCACMHTCMFPFIIPNGSCMLGKSIIYISAKEKAEKCLGIFAERYV